MITHQVARDIAALWPCGSACPKPPVNPRSLATDSSLWAMIIAMQLVDPAARTCEVSLYGVLNITPEDLQAWPEGRQ